MLVLPYFMVAFLAIPHPPAKAPQPTEAALRMVSSLRVKSLGVDRGGNLWAWSGSGLVQSISPAGEQIHRITVPSSAQAVDADAEQGVVAILLDQGWELLWSSWQGETLARFPLPDSATDIRFVRPGFAVVSPQTAPWRAELWDLKGRKVVQTFGEEARLRPTFGATRLRGIFLRIDPRSERLFTLESYTGELQVFEQDGRLAWRGGAENPRRKQVEEWLVDIDRKAKAGNDIQTPVMIGLELALDAAGEPWIIQGFDEKSETTTAIRLSAQGTVTKTIKEPECRSFSSVFWGLYRITYREPGNPLGACTTYRSWP